MDICTIIAKNYLAQARVLAQSFRAQHADGRCSVLVIDDIDGYIDPAREPFTVLRPGDIGCEEFEEMALRYDVLELSTAVKPWLLAHLLDAAPAITYLDPDIEIFGTLEPLDALAREHGLVLTPHNTVPLPDDEHRPNQIDILLAGVYNLGYVSLGRREETATLLGWWRKRLLHDCRVDPLGGYFVDQRWFDLAPGLVSDHVIMREPRYNVAYWNLHSRSLSVENERYAVDGEPLAFFHFSGFDADRPADLSRHQSRIRISPGSPLESICEHYAERIHGAGYDETKSWPYTYHELPSGVKFTRRLRQLHEIAVERGEVAGSPFSEEGASDFMSWLAEPAPAAPPGVNRLLADMYGQRPDLQAAFPDVAGADHEAFLSWADRSGVHEEPTLGLLERSEQGPAPSPALPAAAEPESSPPPERGTWGVNVVGYFRSELGTGEAARQVVSALDAGEVPLLPVHGRTIPPNRQGHAFTHLDHSDAFYPVNLICMNADVLGEFASQVGPSFFAGRYSIGMWFWEVESFPPAWLSAFDHLQELWLPTEHIIRAVRPASTVPITKITLPVEMPTVMPASRAELELPEGFLFLFSFDHHSVFERKNPLAVIDAYRQSFEEGDGAVLVIKSINGDRAAREHERLLEAAGGRPDIHIIDGYLEAARKNLLVDACDCYVSLHRAEGFGLTMAEAMYLGKPVVATRYSGNLDFMTPENSFLVDFRMQPIGPDASPYPPTASWAEPDVKHAARLMRDVFEQREHARAVAARGAEEIRTTHSAKAAGALMAERLELLRGQHQARLVTARAPSSRAAEVDRLALEGPSRGEVSRLGRPGRLARRLMLRLIKPYRLHQARVDRQIAEALASVEGRLSEVETHEIERHASVLARLRQDQSRPELWRRVSGLTQSALALEQLSRRTDAAVQRAEREARAIPYMEGEPFGELRHDGAGVVQGYVGLEAGDLDGYRSFEDTFRGSEDFIRERQRGYVELVRGHPPVFDLGCGRGEFLDLLVAAGIDHIGVDSDAAMVRRCREKGHSEVVLGDGLELLERQADRSLGTIFCAQVIEHLPHQDLLRLFELARRTLADDGLLIAETVNPHSVPALKTFWVDTTHQHPLFPEVALSLARSAGFASAFIFHPNGTGDVRRDRFTQGEYALVAAPASLAALEDDYAAASAPISGAETTSGTS